MVAGPWGDATAPIVRLRNWVIGLWVVGICVNVVGIVFSLAMPVGVQHIRSGDVKCDSLTVMRNSQPIGKLSVVDGQGAAWVRDYEHATEASCGAHEDEAGAWATQYKTHDGTIPWLSGEEKDILAEAQIAAGQQGDARVTSNADGKKRVAVLAANGGINQMVVGGNNVNDTQHSVWVRTTPDGNLNQGLPNHSESSD